MLNKIKLRRKRRQLRKQIKRKLMSHLNCLGVIPTIALNEVCRLYQTSKWLQTYFVEILNVMKIHVDDLYDKQLIEDFYVCARRYLVSQGIDPDTTHVDIDIIYKQKQEVKSLLINKEFKE